MITPKLQLTDRQTSFENQLLNFRSKYSPETPVDALQKRYEACQQCGNLTEAGCPAWGCVDQSSVRRRMFAAMHNVTAPCPYNTTAWSLTHVPETRIPRNHGNHAQ